MIENEIRETTNKEVPMSKKTFTVILGNGAKATRKSDHAYTHATVELMTETLRTTMRERLQRYIAAEEADLAKFLAVPASAIDPDGTWWEKDSEGRRFSGWRIAPKIAAIRKRLPLLREELADLPNVPVGTPYSIVGFHHSFALAQARQKGQTNIGIVEVRSEVR